MTTQPVSRQYDPPKASPYCSVPNCSCKELREMQGVLRLRLPLPAKPKQKAKPSRLPRMIEVTKAKAATNRLKRASALPLPVFGGHSPHIAGDSLNALFFSFAQDL